MGCNVIALDEEDDSWLAEMARQEGVPKTHLIRRAVRAYREQFAGEGAAIESLLLTTPVLWLEGDVIEPEIIEPWIIEP